MAKWNFSKLKLSRAQRIFISNIILPALGLILIAVLVTLSESWFDWNFPYMEQYVIACGPVYSAAVAIYIYRMNKQKDDKKKELGWKTKTKFFTILLDKSINKLDTIIQMTESLRDDLEEKSMKYSVLKPIDFDILRRTFQECNDLSFEALVGREGINQETMAKRFTDIVEALAQSIQYNDELIRTYKTYKPKFEDIKNDYMEAFLTLKILINSQPNSILQINQMKQLVEGFTQKELLEIKFEDIINSLIQPLKDYSNAMDPSATRADIRHWTEKLELIVKNYESKNNGLLNSITIDLRMLDNAKETITTHKAAIDQSIS